MQTARREAQVLLHKRRVDDEVAAGKKNLRLFAMIAIGIGLLNPKNLSSADLLWRTIYGWAALILSFGIPT